MDRLRGRSKAVKGDLRWTDEEDRLLRSHYPDYPVLRAHFPHRTLSALKHRIRAIGIAKRRHIWTNHEIVRLRQAYEEGVTDRELAILFPELRLSQVKSKASYIGAMRRKPNPVRFDVPALDAIRVRSVGMGLSFVELDRHARTGRYFQKSCRRPLLRHIVQAAAFLGAEVSIEWSE